MTRMLISLIVFVVLVVSGWQMYAKARQPGWVSVIPVLNVLGLLKMIGKPYWWALLYLVPVVNVAMHFVVAVLVARSFGKGFLFGVGLFFLPIVFLPMIGLGDARYVGPEA